MLKVNAYLNCVSRQEAQQAWWGKLDSCGYFCHLPTEEVPVSQALGRVTATSVYARQSVPHYNGSAMDGIAVRAQDTFGASETEPKRLSIRQKEEDFAPLGCYIVNTGEVLPQGTDAVIMIEDVLLGGGQAEIMAAAAPWQHVRIIGEDIVANEMVLSEYHVITPPDIAAVLAAGLDTVSVVMRPRVAVIPTGSELVATWQELKPGAILDVNSHMLSAAVVDWGGEPYRHEIVRDDEICLKEAINQCLETCDMVITNAGTSAGTADFTTTVLAQLGEVLLHGVEIKPGKPVALAVCQGKPVIALPGYPVSTMLTAELFVRDILLARQKLSEQKTQQVQAVLSRQVFSPLGVEEYLRVSLGEVQGRMVAAPLGRGAGIISTLTKAQGIVSVPKYSSGFSAGTKVDVSLIKCRQAENTLLSIGSHDLALEILGVFLNRQSSVKISCANVGSMGGVMAIRNNEAHIAGVHLLDERTGQYNLPYLSKYLSGKKDWKLVHLAQREQGLIVAQGNPKNIIGLADLIREDVRFVNRQRGSGTRMLLDYQLPKLGLKGEQIIGYGQEVATHMAVAASIDGGVADVGMGIRAAARALELGFIPIAQEQYDIILNFAEGDERAEEIIDILKSAAFRRDVEALGGYDLAEAGKVLVSQ
ncbi:putative molybdopterin biosynthesis protein [Sporomusaceae bacterium BoRhaA]|nr:putative molybdopterin biosynthesis protein [Pelorhabdus rhamnosifermentans]